jgi:hypothetical protein
MRQKLLNVEYLLWLALALALLGSLKHLASVFASVDKATFMGWVQAVAIDVGLFALAYKIKVRRAHRQPIKLLTGAVALFTIISVYGNLTYGLAALGPLPWPIQVTRPYVLAATLPVLVLILSHLLSDDRQHANELAHKEARKQAKNTEKPVFEPGDLTALALAREQKQANVSRRREQVLALFRAGVDREQIAAELGVSLSTIKRDLAALNGRANGHSGESE